MHPWLIERLFSSLRLPFPFQTGQQAGSALDPHLDPLLSLIAFSASSTSSSNLIPLNKRRRRTTSSQKLSSIRQQTNFPIVHSLNRNRPASLTDEEITQIYFEQLTADDVMDLFYIYENDFSALYRLSLEKPLNFALLFPEIKVHVYMYVHNIETNLNIKK